MTARTRRHPASILNTLDRKKRRLPGAIVVFLAALVACQGCATASSPKDVLALKPLPRQHFVLQPKLLEALAQQKAADVTAYSWTPTGGLIELPIDRPMQGAQAKPRFSLEIPQICAQEPILIRFRSQTEVRELLLEPAGFSQSQDTAVVVPGAKSTLVAQIYTAARAANIWPTTSSPHTLEHFISDASARLLLQIGNQERMLAVLTPGLVAAVQAQKAVMASAPTSLVRTESLLAQSPSSSVGSRIFSDLALQQAQQAAVCVDCGPSQGQMTLASGAGLAALDIYLDKLPVNVRTKMRIELQRKRLELVERMLTSKPLILTQQVDLDAKKKLEKTFDDLSAQIEKLPRAYVQQQMASAWQVYAQALVASANQAHPDLASLWAAHADNIVRGVAALQKTHAQINARVAPQQTGEQLARAYLAYSTSVKPNIKQVPQSALVAQYFDLRTNLLLLKQ